uniref:DWNN domain-containing protein n=1 Tax=Kalanchoe fedtschenkoi TaxID=63787 RepID=A0A7N0RBD8_KALFE
MEVHGAAVVYVYLLIHYVYSVFSEYLDEDILVPKGTSVLIRRIPSRPHMPIVTEQEPKIGNKVEDPEPPNSIFTGADSSTTKYPDDTDWDVFGNDLYAVPEITPVQFMNSTQDAPPPTKEDEDSKIQALIETPALDWQQQIGDGYGPGRGFGRGGRMMGGRGFGRNGSDKRIPPQGYVCHRCKVPGHYIQHCPTNGDPHYDVKKVRPPTGIPKSMLIETPDGSYALPSCSIAVLKPNEAAFEKEIEGLTTTRPVGEIPIAHRCQLCRETMKDAVIAIKCCFATFCDRCIRNHIISKSECVCGKKDVLADDLVPNMIVRDSISRFLECNNNSSAENPWSNYQVQDVESSRCPPARVPSPTLSAASKGEQPPVLEEKINPKPTVDEEQAAAALQQTSENAKTFKVVNVSEADHDSASAKEPTSQMSAPLAEQVHQKAGETGKRIKKKKICAPANAEMQWKTGQEIGAGYVMPVGSAGFNPYWNGVQPGMEAYMPSFGGPMPFMGGYPLGPLDMAYGGFMPQDPFAAQDLTYPLVRPQHPHQRDHGGFGMGYTYNGGRPPAMSREEFEACKADLRRKRELEERRAGRMKGGDLPPRNREPNKPKSRFDDRNGASRSSHQRTPPPRRTHAARHSPPPSHREDEASRPTKRKSSERDHDHSDRHRHFRSGSTERQAPRAVAKSDARSEKSSEGKSKASVFERIRLPEETESGGGCKKRKTNCSSKAASVRGREGSVVVTSKNGSWSGDCLRR